MVEELLDVLFGPWALVAFVALTLGPKLLGREEEETPADAVSRSREKKPADVLGKDTDTATNASQPSPIEDLIPKPRQPRARKKVNKRKSESTRSTRKHHRKAS